jgi:hypothetical protein
MATEVHITEIEIPSELSLDQLIGSFKNLDEVSAIQFVGETCAVCENQEKLLTQLCFEFPYLKLYQVPLDGEDATENARKFVMNQIGQMRIPILLLLKYGKIVDKPMVGGRNLVQLRSMIKRKEPYCINCENGFYEGEKCVCLSDSSEKKVCDTCPTFASKFVKKV